MLPRTCLILFLWTVFSTTAGFSAEFKDLLLKRNINQSIDATRASAELYNLKLWATENHPILSQAGPVHETAISIAHEAELEFMQACERVNCSSRFGSNPSQVVPLYNALETDNYVRDNPANFGAAGLTSEDRRLFLERLYVRYKDVPESELGSDGVTYRDQVRNRLLELMGQQYLNELNTRSSDGKRETPSQFAVSQAEAYSRDQLSRIEEFADRDYFPRLLRQPVKDMSDGIRKTDEALKELVKDTVLSSTVAVNTAESTIKMMLGAARVLNLSPDTQKRLQKLHQTAQTGQKLLRIGLTLARAGAGDISAWFTAVNDVSGLFKSTGPSVDQQILDGINTILDNQKKILEQLDTIIAQLDAVNHQLNEIRLDLVVIDHNVRLLLDHDNWSASTPFHACENAAKHIAAAVADQTKQRFEPFEHPYDMEIYNPILREAVNLQYETDIVDNCDSAVLGLYRQIGDRSPYFDNRFRFRGERSPSDPSIDNEVRGLVQHYKKTRLFALNFKEKYPDIKVSKWDERQLLVAASVPAIALEDVDKKFDASLTNYRFGATTVQSAIASSLELLDAEEVARFSTKMYEMLPYVWISKDRRCGRFFGWAFRLFGCEETDGLHARVRFPFIEALIQSLHTIQLASAQHALVQGDVLLAMLRHVLQRPIPLCTSLKNCSANEMTDELYVLAIEILAENSVLRENFLRYITYHAYKGKDRYLYLMDHQLAHRPEHLKGAFGSTWDFARLNGGTVRDPNKRFALLLPCPAPKRTNEQTKPPIAYTYTNRATKQIFAYEQCSYALPSPSDSETGMLMANSGTKSLQRARMLGNRLLSVIEAYHPNDEYIKNSGL
jgi:hypothetical protein